ncbi:MAG: UDP-N-acetylmuramate dehydrogenase [Christensenellales bacterium]|jgi:UDP-N-acetylmuramate dehydrogenase
MDVTPVVNALKGSEVLTGVPMSRHTSFRLGGPADAMLLPNSTEEILRALAVCKEAGVPFTVIGNGTNLVVKDGGIRGLVIKIGQGMSRISFDGNRATAQAGARLMTLASVSINEKKLAGLAFAGGIPGSVGGAVMMNAGAYDSEIKDVVRKVRYVDPVQLKLCEREIAEGDFWYRGSVFMEQGYVVVEAEFALSPDDGTEKQKLEDYLARRKKKQPLTMPSAGSVFKRPQGHYAGALIEQAGLKGVSVGGAQVSTLHAGFIVNTGNATAKDVISLIELIQKRVYAQSGVMLCPEVRIIGEEQ